MKEQIITLFRPVGQKEFDLIKSSEFKYFPPRLDWQPIFYPVLDYDYACLIAKEWNTNDDDNGNVGYVTQFDIPQEYFNLFEVKNVGARNHNELWVPSEKLGEFNSNIIGPIRIIKAFYGDNFKGIREFD